MMAPSVNVAWRGSWCELFPKSQNSCCRASSRWPWSRAPSWAQIRHWRTVPSLWDGPPILPKPGSQSAFRAISKTMIALTKLHLRNAGPIRTRRNRPSRCAYSWPISRTNVPQSRSTKRREPRASPGPSELTRRVRNWRPWPLARPRPGKAAKSFANKASSIATEPPHNEQLTPSGSRPKCWSGFFKPAAEAYGTDALRQPGCVVRLHRDRTERRFAHRGLEFPRRNTPNEPIHRFVLVHADDGIVIAGHADIGQESRAAWQDPVIGGRNMGMRADDEARTPVAEVPHCLLLARGLAMH